MKDEVLPTLKSNQVFACDSGCGECSAVEFDYEYYKSISPCGEVEKRLTHKAYKSSCCGDTFQVYTDQEAAQHPEDQKQYNDILDNTNAGNEAAKAVHGGDK